MPGEHYEKHSVDEKMYEDAFNFLNQQENLNLQTTPVADFFSCKETGLPISISLDHIRVPIIPDSYSPTLSIFDIKSQLLNIIKGETQGDIN